MLGGLERIAGLFAVFCAISVLQIAMSSFAPSLFSRSGAFYLKRKGSRDLVTRFELHAFLTSSAIVIFAFLAFRDGFQPESLFIFLVILLAALFELSENAISWSSKGVVQRRFLFRYRSINWDEMTTLSVNMPLDGVVFSDGRVWVRFKARFVIDEHGHKHEPSKEVASGVRALARYAQMKLRNKPGLNWRAS